MPWLPQLLNPWTAMIAGTAAAAVLVSLYFLKLRRQERPVSSTLLWRKAIADMQVNTPFQRLRRNLLLLLQLLLLLLLTAALARPVIPFTPGAGPVNVILIDRSASMSAMDGGDKFGQHSRLDEARRRASALIETMDSHAQAMVIAFADSAEVVQPFTSDVAALRRAIDSITPTDRPTQLKLAFQLAEAQGHSFQQGAGEPVRPHVWLYSDGRASDRQDQQTQSLVTFDPIGSDQTGNIAIVALDGRRNYKNPEQVEIFTRLANFGPDPRRADVELRVDGQLVAVKSVSLPPARWSDPEWMSAHPNRPKTDQTARDSLEFTLTLPQSAVVTVRQMNTQSDGLSSDNQASLIVPPPKPLRVLLVTSGNYFLERVLHSLALKHLQILSPKAYSQRHPSDFDVFIFDRFAPPASDLPKSGRFIDIGAIPSGLDVHPLMRAGQPDQMRQVHPLDWNRDHPILRRLQLDRLYVAQSLKLPVSSGDTVLIEGTDGPLMLLHPQGQSQHLIIPFDLLQSNWPVQLSFPIFMHNALQYMALGSSMDVKKSYRPGEAPEISRAEVMASDPAKRPIRLTTPDGSVRTVAIPENGAMVLPVLEQVGVYQLDPPPAGEAHLAVNLLNANESDLRPVAAFSAAQTLHADGSRRGRLDLWWWIVACGFIPILLAEWLYYTHRSRL